jgi:purine-binding chemotaxis protein CheW
LASTTTPPTSGATADAGGDPAAHEAPEAPRLLLFRAAGRLFGCRLEVAREVLAPGAATRLPGAPGHVVGLRNVRGRLVTVLDVARALDASAPPAKGGHVLVVDAGDGRLAGCRVDAALRVVPAPPLDPPASGDPLRNAAGPGIVLGVGRVEGEPVTVLDLPRCVRDTLVDPGEEER